MNKEKYNQIIDEAYENYERKLKLQNNWEITLNIKPLKIDNIGQQKLLMREEFINKCKTDQEFSDKWGLKIEERVLGLDERINLIEDDKDDKIIILFCENPADEWLKDQVNEILTHRNIPTKLITITYKKEKIEIYE